MARKYIARAIGYSKFHDGAKPEFVTLVRIENYVWRKEVTRAISKPSAIARVVQ